MILRDSGLESELQYQCRKYNINSAREDERGRGQTEDINDDIWYVKYDMRSK